MRKMVRDLAVEEFVKDFTTPEYAFAFGLEEYNEAGRDALDIIDTAEEEGAKNTTPEALKELRENVKKIAKKYKKTYREKFNDYGFEMGKAFRDFSKKHGGDFYISGFAYFRNYGLGWEIEKYNFLIDTGKDLAEHLEAFGGPFTYKVEKAEDFGENFDFLVVECYIKI